MSDLAYIGTPRAEVLARLGDGDGSGGGSSGGMDLRIAHLETRMGRVEDKLDKIIERLGSIATRADMRGYLLAAVAIFVGLIAILVTAMGWLEAKVTRTQPVAAAPAAQPIIVQVPYPAQAPAKNH